MCDAQHWMLFLHSGFTSRCTLPKFLVEAGDANNTSVRGTGRPKDRAAETRHALVLFQTLCGELLGCRRYKNLITVP